MLAKYYKMDAVVVRGTNGAIEGDPRDEGVFRRYATEGEWSGRLLDMVKSRMKRSATGTYIDIGANIGLTTIPLARNSSWSFFAFEPDPANFLRLRLNLLRNSIENVCARNVAMSNANGKLILRRSPTNFGDFRLDSNVQPIGMNWANDKYDEAKWDKIEVQTRTLDDSFKELALAGPLIMKIDTQGAEPLIVGGGRQTLSRADLVIMEFWPYGIARQGVDPIAFIDVLAGLFGSVTAISAVEGDPLADNFEAIKRLVSGNISTEPTGYFDLILTEPKRVE
ncbi:FkbM family methyltransferase [Bradyrhizobium sp. AT1]|uniref:FkbM family methyltransferase n=1 Tax=Bradyrhizobium sp. AT1 TaxID=574934 RepID=UPI0009FC024A|nr:FkbM family methyltransferase [Bradyrhizobium sp. AT1]